MNSECKVTSFGRVWKVPGLEILGWVEDRKCRICGDGLETDADGRIISSRRIVMFSCQNQRRRTNKN
ncbi:hypothetical protein EVA_15624 [gut metagenome]|uniref:Uncharacterized protein n=1 Tax=gut metagenome TaxID=749906 RepID=J9C8P8_9ZZZZ